MLAIGTQGERAWRISIATEALSCEDLVAAYPQRPTATNGEIFDFWLAQPLGNDGKPQHWSIRSAFVTDALGGRGLVTRGAMVDNVRDDGDGLALKGLELALQDRKKGKRLIGYTGNLKAKRCKRVSRKEATRPQTKLKLTIAQRPISVTGASIRPSGSNYILRLTREPHSCTSVFTQGYDWYLDITLSGTPPTMKFAALQGELFPETPTGSKGKDTFELKPAGAIDGRGPWKLKLDGQLDLTGYQVRLAGDLSALRCIPSAASTSPSQKAAPKN